MLDICLAISADYAKRPMLEGEHWTDECLEMLEWEEIFFIELMGYCPFISRSEMEGLNVNTIQNLRKQRFQEAIPNYPLLARMWHEYIDVFYASDEINELRRECLSVKAKTKNALALQGLEKLIRCCKQATAENLGLFLACD